MGLWTTSRISFIFGASTYRWGNIVGSVQGNPQFDLSFDFEVEVITLEGDTVESHMEALDAVEMLSTSVLMADMTVTTVADSCVSSKAA